MKFLIDNQIPVALSRFLAFLSCDTVEEAKREIISVFSEAGKGIHFWLEYLERDEIDKLLEASAIVTGTKEWALKRQQKKLR